MRAIMDAAVHCTLSSLSSTSRAHRCSRRHPWPQATRRQRKRRPASTAQQPPDGVGAARATMDATASRLPGALLLYCKHKGHRRLLRAQQGLCCVRSPDHDCSATVGVASITFADRLASAQHLGEAQARRGRGRPTRRFDHKRATTAVSFAPAGRARPRPRARGAFGSPF